MFRDVAHQSPLLEKFAHASSNKSQQNVSNINSVYWWINNFNNCKKNSIFYYIDSFWYLAKNFIQKKLAHFYCSKLQQNFLFKYLPTQFKFIENHCLNFAWFLWQSLAAHQLIGLFLNMHRTWDNIKSITILVFFDFMNSSVKLVFAFGIPEFLWNISMRIVYLLVTQCCWHLRPILNELDGLCVWSAFTKHTLNLY